MRYDLKPKDVDGLTKFMGAALAFANIQDQQLAEALARIALKYAIAHKVEPVESA